jgi:S-adenosylmethionine-diacylglycerol 3-amino-3-carboxypropyl transferase
MTGITRGLPGRKTRHIRDAVLRHSPISKAGLSERLFAFVFSGLVYPQIWEDPEVDMQAMALTPESRIVTIGSGGCNVLSYLTQAPARIDVVDLNRAHIALNKLKLASVAHLPSQSDFFRFFAGKDQAHNSLAYRQFIAPHLDAQSRAYWEGRGIDGRQRITVFDRNFYRSGLLGLFISAGHLAARLHGVNPAEIMQTRSMREQRQFFDELLAPLFDKPLIRLVTRSKASLFGLGIPPAQYEELAAADAEMRVTNVLRARLEKLACHFPLEDNYFAWQAFARHYPEPNGGSLPPYLQARHHATLRENAGRVFVHHQSFTTLLADKPASSVDRYILLDAQDWMSDAQLNALWTEICRTAAPGARVIFRTAGEPSILPGRLLPVLLDQWNYNAAASAEGHARDRSAIYGGFHVYERKGA